MQLLSGSTRRHLRTLQRSILDLRAHVARRIRHGGDLRKACAGRSGLLLNIGCGPHTYDGWINIDIDAIAGRSFYHDALDPLPIADGAVRHIHCEHFLEHLEYADARAFLGECHRVLETGGTMRVIVPDAERYMRAYCAEDRAFFDKLVDLGGAVEPLRLKNEVCNQAFRMGGAHKFGWDLETLQATAATQGFASVQRSEMGAVAPQYRIDGTDWWRAAESLYANLAK